MAEQVLVRRIRDLGRDVAEALDFLKQDFAGLRVWVKPNLLGPHRPEQGVTTDPELVRRVVRELRARGAREVRVFDNPGGSLQGAVRDFVEPTGVVAAAEGCFWNATEAPVELRLKSRFVASVRVSALIGQVDLVLNLPVLKTHGLTLLTGAIKNVYGIIAGAQKTELHGRVRRAADFAELLVDIYEAVPVPMLHLMDAARGMDGLSGPSSGRVLRLGRLLAARNGVALDSVMALMAGTRPKDVPTIRIAGERGLGPTEQSDIEIRGEFEVVPGFRMPSAGIAERFARLSPGVYRLMRRRPLLQRGRCTRCGVCARNCPVGAIRMDPYPVIARKLCISCFCCCELCPERAMQIPGRYRNLLHNMLGK